jgi:hypothetical protein
MGALGNSGRKLANLAGFYKGLQSAGAAVMWSPSSSSSTGTESLILKKTTGIATMMEPHNRPKFEAYFVFFKIKDSVPVEEELEGTGETLEDVLPPGAVESFEAYSFMNGIFRESNDHMTAAPADCRPL